LRKSHKEKLQDLHSSVDVVVVIKSRRMGWAEHAARMTNKGNACKYLEEAIIKMKPLSRRRIRWENNIKMEINRIGQESGPAVDLYISEHKKLACCCVHKMNPTFS
jgi:hypothetical protein